MRELRIARYRQLALDLGEAGGDDRWGMLPNRPGCGCWPC